MKRILHCKQLLIAFVYFIALAGMQMSAQTDHVVISQVYGGGGNAGATYNRDFVEIFNPSPSAVVMTNWSIQYASSAGTTWTVASFSGTIQPGKYFLIQLQLAGGSPPGIALPTADATNTVINMSGTAGKVALVNNITALSGACPAIAAIVDKIGYGGANCSETSTATAPSNNTTSMQRINNGCTDVGNNSTDFAVLNVAPRNSSTTASYCAPTKLAITAITPASPIAGQGFSVTIQSQDPNGAPKNVIAATGITLSTNNNAGPIGGTTTGTIAIGTSEVTISGVTLETPGIGATITATRTSGDVLTASTSVPFDVSSASSPILGVSGTTAHGTVCLGSSGSGITYMITNSGSVAAEGITVTSNNPSEFTVSALSSTTISASGGTATYTVVFTPASAGLKLPDVTIQSTTTGSNTVVSSLTGTGVAQVAGQVSTIAANPVGANSATLNGNVATLGTCPSTTAKGFVYSKTSLNADPVAGGTDVTTLPVGGLATGNYSNGISSLTSGTGYTFKAYLFDGTTYIYGNALTFTTTSPPANDSCSNAIVLTAGVLKNGVLSTATADFAGGKKDVWYSFIPSCTGSHTITVNYPGIASVDVDFEVYTGAVCPSAAGGSSFAKTDDNVEAGSLTLNSGTSYLIRVLDFGGTATTFDITVTPTTAPTFTLGSLGNPAAGSLASGAVNVPLLGFSLTTAGCGTFDFTAASITVTGSANASDLSNFRLIRDSNSDGVADAGEITAPIAAATSFSGTLVFTGITGQTGITAARRYLLIADVNANPVSGHTFTAALAAANVTASVPVSGSVTGNLQTVPPPNYLAINAFATPVSENFDSMGTTTVSPPGFGIQDANTTSVTTTLGAQASSGTPVSGASYNWGQSASERALGLMFSGGYSDKSVVAKIRNNTSAPIGTFTLNYTYEQYRRNATSQTFKLQYSTSLTTGWTDVANGDFTSLVIGANSYNFTTLIASQTISNLVFTPSTPVAVGTDVYFRWILNGGSNSTGVGIDNFSISGCPVLTATVVSNNSAICAANDAIFNLSGSAGATVTYNINGGSPQTVVLAGGTAIVTVPNATTNRILNLTSVSEGACSQALTGPSATSTVTVNELPAASITSNNSPICSGSTATFTLTGTSGSVVTYSINSGTPATITLTGGTGNVSVSNATVAQSIALLSITNPANGCGQNISGTDTVSLVPVTFTSVTSSSVCAGAAATVSVNGLVPGSTSTIAYTKTPGGAQPPVVVTANESGVGTFDVVVTGAGQSVTINSVTRTDSTPDCSINLSSGNSVTFVLSSGCTIVQPSQCGMTLTNIDSYVYSTLIAQAQGYRWRVTALTGSDAGNQQIATTALRNLKLTSLSNYAFDTQYQIEVSVRRNNVWGPYGPSCTVSTPATKTQLVSCGGEITSMSNVIYAEAVPFAQGYRFRITDPLNPTNTQILYRPLREFRMSLITAFPVQYGKTYNVEVSILNTANGTVYTDGGRYLPFVDVCNVTTPTRPTVQIQTSQCATTVVIGGEEQEMPYDVPSSNTSIYADSFPGAVQYVFLIYGGDFAAGQYVIVEKALRTFKLSDLPASPGLTPGEIYSVRVRLVFEGDAPAPAPDVANNSFPQYGKACTFEAPPASVLRNIAPEFNALAYPNPFIANFSIDMTTSEAAKVSIKVYDMTGRLLDNFSTDVAGLKSLVVGEKYPSGVYNVIVSQDEHVETLRVIKR
jgi:hypothetical protein